MLTDIDVTKNEEDLLEMTSPAAVMDLSKAEMQTMVVLRKPTDWVGYKYNVYFPNPYMLYALVAGQELL